MAAATQYTKTKKDNAIKTKEVLAYISIYYR